MNTKKIVLSSLLIAGAIAAVGLRSSSSDAQSVARTNDVDKTELEQSNLRAPLIVDLVPGPIVADEQTVQAIIQVNDSIRYPVTLTATAPSGGQITEGVANETLDLSAVPAGTRMTRTFRVKGATSQNPLRVVLGGASKGNVIGFRAEKQFPAAPPSVTMAKYGGPKPITGRPPAPHALAAPPKP